MPPDDSVITKRDCTLFSSSPDAPLNIDGFGPYFVNSPPMVGTIPMLVVMVVNLSP